MIKLWKYLKKSAGYILIIVLLLFFQANCDLALPDYTSKIINVGIQQYGIEDAIPKKIRKTSLEDLEIFLSKEEVEKVEALYEEKDGVLQLKKVSEEEKEEIKAPLGKSMMAVMMLQSDNEISANIRSLLKVPEGEDVLAYLKKIPKMILSQFSSKADEMTENLPEAIITQSAIAYISTEYSEMGENLDQMRMKYLFKTGLQMVLMALSIVLAAVLITFLSARVAAGFGHDLRSMIYQKVISFSTAEYQKFSTASLITRSTNDVQQVQMTTAIMLRMLLYAPIIGIGGLLKVIRMDVSMTWILGVAIGIILILIFTLFKIAMPKFTKLQEMIDRLNLVSREILTGTLVIRAFSREKTEVERFEKANLDLTKTNLFVNRCMTFMMPIMMLVMNGISVTIIYVGSHAVDAGNMQVGNMMAFIQYSMQIIMSFLMISMMSIMLPRANVAGKRIVAVLETDLSILDPENTETAVKDERGLVEFEHVNFRYPDGDGDTLEDISFTARKGETVAFIGGTGCGKSTLINLIPRFYDVTGGSVRVDGVDVRKQSLKELRSKIGYVPQKGVLFSGTIGSNILYGAPEAGEAEMKKAAEVAQAVEFIEAKSDQYASDIAQGGSNVSGGQKQRLSIARAIAKNPEIYIFDDSFSALDYKTDVELRAALKKYTKDATTLIVAQRISTILQADQIIVLEEGRVAGKGTHEELMKDCEVYRQIAMSQLSEEELSR